MGRSLLYHKSNSSSSVYSHLFKKVCKYNNNRNWKRRKSVFSHFNLVKLCTECEKTENEITQRLLGSLFGAKDERHFPNF